jgi:hypothetical protein
MHSINFLNDGKEKKERPKTTFRALTHKLASSRARLVMPAVFVVLLSTAALVFLSGDVPKTDKKGATSRDTAVTYRYVDDKGVIHITNKKESIPGQYRDGVETVHESPPSGGYMSGPEERKDEPFFRQLTGRLKVLRLKGSLSPLLAGFITFSASIAVLWILYSNVRGRALRFAIILIFLSGLGIGVFHLYARHLSATVAEFKQDLEDVKKAAENHAESINELTRGQ